VLTATIIIAVRVCYYFLGFHVAAAAINTRHTTTAYTTIAMRCCCLSNHRLEKRTGSMKYSAGRTDDVPFSLSLSQSTTSFRLLSRIHARQQVDFIDTRYACYRYQPASQLGRRTGSSLPPSIQLLHHSPPTPAAAATVAKGTYLPTFLGKITFKAGRAAARDAARSHTCLLLLLLAQRRRVSSSP
jgi:hypothetical protein